MDQDSIIIVSGLPRSGTSMMMQMLETGGLEILTDNIRTADQDNPKGYYEFEVVKKLAKDENKEWLNGAKDKVVKVISQLLKDLPQEHNYRVIFMNRKMEEILFSQKQMLIRRGVTTDSISDEELAKLFQKHLGQVESWLEKQPNFDVLYISYNEVLKDPEEFVDRVNKFLGGHLDVDSMKSVVDKSLHRQRA